MTARASTGGVRASRGLPLAGPLLASLVAACGAPGLEPPLDSERCTDAPEMATLDRLEIVTDEPPFLALEDGATLPLLFGGQGAEMTLFRIGAGPGAPPCLRLRVRAFRPDGALHLELDETLRTEQRGELRLTGPLAAVQPGESIVLEAESYGVTLRRELELGGLRASLRVEGPVELAIGETSTLTVVLSGRPLEPLPVSVEASPPEVATLGAEEVVVPAGESRVTVTLTALSAGTSRVRARLDAYESPAFAVEVR